MAATTLIRVIQQAFVTEGTGRGYEHARSHLVTVLLLCLDNGYPNWTIGVGPKHEGHLSQEAVMKGRALLDAVASKNEGSVEYRWLNPITHKVEPKMSFVQKVGEDVCGVGAYNPKS